MGAARDGVNISFFYLTHFFRHFRPSFSSFSFLFDSSQNIFEKDGRVAKEERGQRKEETKTNGQLKTKTKMKNAQWESTRSRKENRANEVMRVTRKGERKGWTKDIERKKKEGRKK